MTTLDQAQPLRALDEIAVEALAAASACFNPFGV
jgi:hypothetical protein